MILIALIASLLLAANTIDPMRAGAEKGSAEAQFELGKRYLVGEGLPSNPQKAVKWLRKSADQGFAVAEFDLGVMYARGIGVPMDKAEAASWLRKAGAQGDVHAQLRLGAMYAEGKDVPEDARESVYWYRKAADQGSVVAQFILGMKYGTGIGAPKDSRDSMHWFHKVAEQGILYSQFFVGVECATGKHSLMEWIEILTWIATFGLVGNYCIGRFLTIQARSTQGVPRRLLNRRIWKIGRKVLPWLLLLALVSRRPDRLLVPQFWAEDGKVFFSQAYRAGIGVWFHPYAGYFHLMPRVIAWAWAKLPWAWTPLAYNLSALTVWALIIWRIGTARLPAGFRWLAAASIVFTIHSGEVFLNITNLNWPLGLILAVNLLEPYPRSSLETARRCIEVLVAGLSGPLILIAMGGVLLRSYSWRKRPEGWMLIFAFVAAATLQGTILFHAGRSIHFSLPTIAIELVEVFPLYMSTLAGVTFLKGCPGLCMLLVGLGWCVLIALLIRHGLNGKDRWQVFAITLGAAACLATGRISVPDGIWGGPIDPINARYTYIPLVLMTWLVAWIASRSRTRTIRRIALSMVCMAFASSLVQWQECKDTDHHWASQVTQAKLGRTQMFVTPPEWRFPVPQDKPVERRS